MHTNIDIEEQLLEETLKFTDIKVKNLLELKGKIKFSEDNDYKSMREAK